MFERLRSFNVDVILSSQSVEGLHDDEAERQRLLNAASTLIAHRLADADPIVTRDGTIRRPERSHQLDPSGATGMGSLRLQDNYRIDPTDLRSLPPGIAWIATGGRAGKVAISRGGQALPAGPSRRGWRGSGVVGPGDPALGRPDLGDDGRAEPEPPDEPVALSEENGAIEQAPIGPVGERSAAAPSEAQDRGSAAAERPAAVRSPYAQGL